MPAFASFFNGQMPGAIFLASMNSLILRTKQAASSSRVRLSRKSTTELRSSEEFIIPNRYDERDKGYLELHDTRRFGEYGNGSTRTQIRGEGHVPTDLEEGVVRKTVTVQQSRQAPPLTQV